jgi:hypothetical protein
MGPMHGWTPASDPCTDAWTGVGCQDGHVVYVERPRLRA